MGEESFQLSAFSFIRASQTVEADFVGFQADECSFLVGV
jgi:hypothetical protein